MTYTLETRIVAAFVRLAAGGEALPTDYDDDSVPGGRRTDGQADVFVVPLVHCAWGHQLCHRHLLLLLHLPRLECHCPFPSWTFSGRWSAAPGVSIAGAGSFRFVVVAGSPFPPHSGPAPVSVSYPTDPGAA